MSQAENGQGPTPGQIRAQYEARKEQATHSAAVSGAVSDAQSKTLSLDEFSTPGIIEEFADPDIDGPDDDLEALLSAEFGKHLAFSNLTREDAETQALLDRMRARLVKTEFPRSGRIGSKCKGETRAIMLGDEAGDDPERPNLTGEMAREIDAAFEERTYARNLSVDGFLTRHVLEAIIYNRSESSTNDAGGSGGILDRTVGRLLR